MAADLVEQSVHETLTDDAFPDIHWQKIPHQQSIERIMKRSAAEHVSLAFPDGQSCLNLAVVRLTLSWYGMVSQVRHEHAALISLNSMQTEAVANQRCEIWTLRPD